MFSPLVAVPAEEKGFMEVHLQFEEPKQKQEAVRVLGEESRIKQ